MSEERAVSIGACFAAVYFFGLSFFALPPSLPLALPFPPAVNCEWKDLRGERATQSIVHLRAFRSIPAYRRAGNPSLLRFN